MNATFTATSRYDKHVNPEVKTYRYLTYTECKQLNGHSDVLGSDGRIAHVKITSLHTFKTRTELQIGWKYGMYEYGRESISKDSDNRFFVIEVESDKEPEDNPDGV